MATATPQTALDDVNEMFPEDEAPAAPNLDMQSLATAIVGAVNAAQGPRVIKNAEYQRTRSQHRDKPQLTRRVYQNGFLLTRRQMSEDAINLANTLLPGIYADGTVQVVPMRDGAAGMSLDIRYANKSPDERMNFKSRFPSFEHLLAAIVREQQPAQ